MKADSKRMEMLVTVENTVFRMSKKTYKDENIINNLLYTSLVSSVTEAGRYVSVDSGSPNRGQVRAALI